MTFVEAYAEVVRTHGDRVALETRSPAGMRTLTHAQLWSRTGDFAASLSAAGLGPDDVVALPHGRSEALVVGMLASWRAGAAWFVADPSVPEPRNRALMERAGVRARLDAVTGSVEPLSSTDPRDRPERSPCSRLAYVARTSGSSGSPRAVRIENAGLLPMLRAQIEAFGLEPHSRCLWVLAPTFDASVSDIGTALLAGATLLIEEAPTGWHDVLVDRAVTSVDLPPALLPRLDVGRLPECLQSVIVGGEVADVSAARRFAERLRLVNVYGPTEATVCTSLERCMPDWRGGTLGQPLPHVRYREVEGELWIGGSALARDYAGDPERTAERFVVDRGERWYRTGDRVRREKSEWVFVGRFDRQVQLAGRRAEPGEVEAALARVGVIAAVVPRTIAGRTALVAFVEDDAVDPGWEATLRATLPEWLVPRRWVALPALPRTRHGKIDLDALARRTLTTPPAAVHDGVDPVVDRLVALFGSVLGRPVGADDDFYALGGDSLALLDLLARAEASGVPLSASQVLHAGTPRKLVTMLDRANPELRSTAELAAWVPVSPHANGCSSGDALVLTGATGFLGRRLRRALLDAGHPVIALVRAREDRAARARLGDPDGEVLAADVARPRMGLDEARWANLITRAHTVVHLAAEVSLASSLEALAPSNVSGALHALELAAAAGAELVHASTLSVFVASDRSSSVFCEGDDAVAPCRIAGGYAQSKWVAEQLVRRAALPGVIIRYGLLTGDAETGESPRGDWLARFVRTLSSRPDLRSRLRALDLAFDATPIDHAVRATQRIIERSSRETTTVHVAGAQPVQLSRLVDALPERSLGLPRSDVVFTLGLARARDPERYARHRALDLFAATGAHFDMRNARALGIEPPRVDDAYLRRWVRAMLRPASEAMGARP